LDYRKYVEANPREEKKAKAALNQQRKEREHQELVRKYYNKIRDVKQSVRKDKRNSINEMAGQAENAAAIRSVK
jgi:hypothetical protein